MIKNLIITVLLALLGIVVLAFIKTLDIKAGMAEGANFKLPPEAVTTYDVESKTWSPVRAAIGSVVAINGVTVSADLPGVVERIAFESGSSVKSGDLLVEMDFRQEKADSESAKARLRLSEVNLKRIGDLVRKQASAQSELDTAEAEHNQAAAAVAEVQARIDRKTIRAPFDGVVGIRQADIGQYLNAGDAIVSLQSYHPLYIRFSVPQQGLDEVPVGRKIRITGAGLPAEGREAEITALESGVNESTRNILVQATVDNTDLKLKPGMFVDVKVQLPAEEGILAVPASSIRYAPFGNSVFVIKEIQPETGDEPFLGVEQRFVELGASRGDMIAIQTGLQAGEKVVSSGVFKLSPNVAVRIENVVAPSAELNPNVPDT